MDREWTWHFKAVGFGYFQRDRVKRIFADPYLIIINLKMNEYETDLKDPFNGGPKAIIVGITFFLTLVPWMAIAPVLGYFVIEYSQVYNPSLW